MLDHKAFSDLRLGKIFPPAELDEHPFYSEVKPNRGFDTEYLGGQWHEELIDGVQFFYPAAAGTKLGVVELWAAGCVVSAAVRDKPVSRSADVAPAWAANANRVMEALELPIRMESDEAAVRSLAVANVLSNDYPDEWYQSVDRVARGTVRALSFAHRSPSLYHVEAIVHSTNGLLKLVIRRPDLVRKNDSEGAYDECFGWLYDEGDAE
jgi:hypothetical protein